MDAYLKDNVARVRDIELLTGLIFFSRMNVSNATRLKTYLPVDIWPAEKLRKWIDEPCSETQSTCTDRLVSPLPLQVQIFVLVSRVQ